MVAKVTMLVCILLSFGCLAWAADQTVTGTVSDSNCGTKHAAANNEAAACVEKCVSGGAKYTLISDGKEYKVEPQEKLNRSRSAGRWKGIRSVSLPLSPTRDRLRLHALTGSGGRVPQDAGLRAELRPVRCPRHQILVIPRLLVHSFTLE